MGREHDIVLVMDCQNLYCQSRKTFKQIAEMTGVSTTTLRRWAATYKWQEKKVEVAQAHSDITSNTLKARAAMLEKLATDRSPQLAFAVASLESLALRQAAEKQPTALLSDGKQLASTAEALEALWQSIQNSLAIVLSDPTSVDLKKVRELAAAIELVDSMRTKHVGSGKKKNPGLSKEVAEKMWAVLNGHG